MCVKRGSLLLDIGEVASTKDRENKFQKNNNDKTAQHVHTKIIIMIFVFYFLFSGCQCIDFEGAQTSFPFFLVDAPCICLVQLSRALRGVIERWVWGLL